MKHSISINRKLMLLPDNFKSLIDIADDSDLSVLKYDDKAGTVTYYVVDNECIYYYEAKGIILDMSIISYNGAISTREVIICLGMF